MQLSLFPNNTGNWSEKNGKITITPVPFVDEVETFNATFGKPNNYERGDIVEILDALCDITYVSLGNGVMLHGLKDKIWPAYQEVQASNMSKACTSEKEAMETVSKRSEEQGEACHFEKLEEGRYIVYRTRDRKVMKSINYFRPDLSQFFNKDELK